MAETQFSFNSLMEITKRPPIDFVEGHGSWLKDSNGKEYLDFVQGWAVTCLGHSPKALVRALTKQAAKLINCSPAFYNGTMIRLADLIVKHSCLQRVFFANSGAEANEGAVKLARKWGAKYKNGAYEIITLDHAFHYSIREVAAAADVPVELAHHLADFEQILVVDGYLTQADAITLVRGLAHTPGGRAPLTPLPTAKRRGGVPLMASGVLHAAGVAVLLLASSLGLLRSADTDTDIPDKTPVPLVFLMTPGPGGGGGGGALKLPAPPPRAERKAPAAKKTSSPVPPPRPYRPPPRPVAREVVPPPPTPTPLPSGSPGSM